MISKADIEKRFRKQLKKIGSPELREKVVTTWHAACSQGGWNSIEEIETLPFTLLTDTHGVNFIEHTIAVTEGAYALGKSQQAAYRKMPYIIDFDRLVAGAILHDVGKLVATAKDANGNFATSLSGRCMRHPISGTVLAAAAGCDERTLKHHRLSCRGGQRTSAGHRNGVDSTRPTSPLSIRWS